MRCALVIPPWQPEDIFPAPTAKLQANYWQPLGLLYLAACLRQEGHKVLLLDGGFLSSAEIMERLKAWGPGLVGVHCNTFLWPRALGLLRTVKEQGPGVFTCLGGPHPTARPRECLAEAGADLDAVVQGEGEETLPHLARALEQGEPLAQVAGLVWRAGDQVVANQTRPLLMDLDRLPPPARDLLEEPGRYLPPPGTYRQAPVATLLTSRGCSGRCVYCFQLDPQRRVRVRGVDRVLAEIESCLEQGYREIRFLDDSLTAQRGRVLELCRGIEERGLKFPWFASSCVNQVDPELLTIMARAGCWSILLGAESGVRRDLKALGKGITPEQIRQAVGWAKDAGLHVVTPFLLGIPGQSGDDFRRTVAFACRLNPDVANFHTVAPFPGTELYEKAAQWGSLSPRWEDYTFQGMAFIPHTLSRREMEDLRNHAFRAFYTRPRLLMRKALSLRGREDRGALWLGLKGLFRLWAGGNIFRRTRP